MSTVTTSSVIITTRAMIGWTSSTICTYFTALYLHLVPGVAMRAWLMRAPKCSE